MDGQQFKLRPSAAHIWLRCNGYVAMSSRYPEQPGDDEVREDGTACHEVAYQQGQFGKLFKVGDVTSNGRPVTDEMLEAVDGYLAMLRSWGLPVYLETSLAAGWIHHDCGGTPDAFAVDMERKIIRLADLKFGFRRVEVFENPQLVIYLVAIMQWLGLNGADDQEWWGEFSIYQPRDFGRDPIKRWLFKLSDVRGTANQLRSAAQNAMSPNPMLQAGPHCANCSARHGCETLKNAAAQVLEISGQAVPLELDPASTGDELRRLEMAMNVIKARISGLEQRAEHMIRAGAYVPWYELKPYNSKRKWKEGSEAKVLAIGSLYGVDLKEPVKPKSPAQVEKLLPDMTAFTDMIERSSSLKLTRVDVNHARKVFSQ